jgi:hypothetical protein
LEEGTRHQWLSSVISSTQEAEITIVVRSQPRETVCKTLSQNSSIHNRAGRVTQVIEYLPSKCEALSSNPNTDQKKRRKEVRRKKIVAFIW